MNGPSRGSVRKRWSLARLALIGIASILLTWFTATEIVYQVQVRKLSSKIRSPRRILPRRFTQAAWVAFGETGSMRQSPALLGWTPAAFLGPVLFHQRKLSFGSGFQAASHAQRAAFSWQGNAHWERLLATIWMTRHWSAEMSISAALDSAYYGCSIFGADKAALFYFGKPIDSLDTPECVALLVIRQHPYETPWKQPDEFGKRCAKLVDAVAANWPESGPTNSVVPRFRNDSCPTTM